MTTRTCSASALSLGFTLCAGVASVGAAHAAAADVVVQPFFHMAPALLAEPAGIDAGGTGASARAEPFAFRADAGVATARLTPASLVQRVGRARAMAAASPATEGIGAAVYTPSQIRAAYGLPDLPVAGAAITAAAAAKLGAGETIYIVDATHNASALDDLNRFSAKFGLPTCAGLSVKSTTLPAAGATCSFAQVYSDGGSNLSTSAPAYDASWASEIALDVQWAHAIAPLARIVLIEVPSATSSRLAGGVALANRMGPGVVSMSFGASEGSWMNGVESNFTAAGMSYVAASGDSAAQVNWPASSTHVLAVGGTSLGWSAATTVRREAAWSNAGGGISAYFAVPAWQAGLVMPGTSAALKFRGNTDVSFNADPMTGQYVALTAPGSTTTNWNSYGGTSIAAPQWAGILAIGNAMRVAAGKARLGDVHGLLYSTIAKVPGNYAAALADVTAGRAGPCATCVTAVGYDQPTGWGTPNVASLLPLLAGGTTDASASAPVAPGVPGGAFTTKAKTAFSQSLGITAPSGVKTSYALSGAPSGLVVSDGGVLSWAAPVAGNYSFTATATTSAGASASGKYTLAVTANRAPVLVGGSFAAATTSAFGARVTATDPDGDALTYSIDGAPAGLAISGAGSLSWAKPVKGNYSFKVTAKDAGGLGATATFTLVVSVPNNAPVVAAAKFTTRANAAFSGQVVASDLDNDAITFAVTGAPAGVTIGKTGVLSWSKAVKGTYSMRVTVTDARGAASGAAVTLVVNAN